MFISIILLSKTNMNNIDTDYLQYCKFKLIDYLADCDTFLESELDNADFFINHLITKVNNGKKVLQWELYKLNKIRLKFNF